MFKRVMVPRKPPSMPRPITGGRVVRADGMARAQPKPIEHRRPALLAMANGKPCLLRVPSQCNRDPRTTVAAHSNWAEHGKGGARKADDQYSVWACSACHAWLDQGSAPKAVKQSAFMAAHLDQVVHWRLIATDTTSTPAEKRTVLWALQLLNATPSLENQ